MTTWDLKPRKLSRCSTFSPRPPFLDPGYPQFQTLPSRCPGVPPGNPHHLGKTPGGWSPAVGLRGRGRPWRQEAGKVAPKVPRPGESDPRVPARASWRPRPFRTLARPPRPEPSTLHGAARPQSRTAEPSLAGFLPFSGSWAQPALIPALKLNTRAARRPPGRRREAAAVTRKRARPAPGDAAAAHGRPLTRAGWGHQDSSPHLCSTGRRPGTPAHTFSGSVDAILLLKATQQN